VILIYTYTDLSLSTLFPCSPNHQLQREDAMILNVTRFLRHEILRAFGAVDGSASCDDKEADGGGHSAVQQPTAAASTNSTNVTMAHCVLLLTEDASMLSAARNAHPPIPAMRFRLFSQRFAQMLGKLRCDADLGGALLPLPLDATHIWSCVDSVVAQAAQLAAEERAEICADAGKDGGNDPLYTQGVRIAKHIATAQRAIKELDQQVKRTDPYEAADLSPRAQLVGDLVDLRDFLRELQVGSRR
jgi:hypothetical protein